MTLRPLVRQSSIPKATGGVLIATIILCASVLPVWADQSSTVSSSASPVLTQPKSAADWLRLGVEKAKTNDLEGAIADFNQAITLKRDYALAYYNRGTAYANLGNQRSALADYTQVMLLKPNNAYVRYNRGVLRADGGDKQGAISDLQQAADLFKQQLNVQWQQKALNKVKQLQEL